MSFVSIFKEHIKFARIYLAISQEDLANLISMSTTAIRNLEKGYGEISCKNSTEKNIRKVFEERGIVFKLTDKGFPYIEYDPDKDVIGCLKDKK